MGCRCEARRRERREHKEEDVSSASEPSGASEGLLVLEHLENALVVAPDGDDDGGVPDVVRRAEVVKRAGPADLRVVMRLREDGRSVERRSQLEGR